MIRVAFVIGDYPPEQRRLREDVAKSYSSADVEVGIVPVAARPFDGLGPAEIQAAAPLFHDAFRRAEREGYDAVVPLGMLDLGVDGGRSAVDIPVVAPLQAALHVAAQVGERFGVVCYHPSAIPRHRAQTRAYGMEILHRRTARQRLLCPAHRRQPGQDGGVVPRGGARADRGGRRRRHHPARHHPMPGADEAAMARRASSACRWWKASARRSRWPPCWCRSGSRKAGCAGRRKARSRGDREGVRLSKPRRGRSRPFNEQPLHRLGSAT